MVVPLEATSAKEQLADFVPKRFKGLKFGIQ